MVYLCWGPVFPPPPRVYLIYSVASNHTQTSNNNSFGEEKKKPRLMKSEQLSCQTITCQELTFILGTCRLSKVETKGEGRKGKKIKQWQRPFNSLCIMMMDAFIWIYKCITNIILTKYNTCRFLAMMISLAKCIPLYYIVVSCKPVHIKVYRKVEIVFLSDPWCNIT